MIVNPWGLIVNPWSLIVNPWGLTVCPWSLTVYPWGLTVYPWGLTVCPWGLTVCPWGFAEIIPTPDVSLSPAMQTKGEGLGAVRNRLRKGLQREQAKGVSS
ncbi:MAG: hypothetical protein LBF62_02995 [Tannerellaceae bacterium]|nr:hypothetical protein [Tannerellaceae bacterium]